MHIGHELITPKSTAIVEAGRLGTATKTKQIDGMNLMRACQYWDVVAPVIGGSPKTMHKQHSRPLEMTRLWIRPNTETMHGMTLELPPGLLGLAHHNFCFGRRC